MSATPQPQPEGLTKPPSSGSGSGYPPAAVVPLIMAAVLMMLEGLYLVAYGSNLTFSTLIPSGSTIPSLYYSGYVAFLEGVLVLVLAIVAVAWRGWHRFAGVGSITLGLLSLFSGGGFLLGAFLAYVGGVIAVYHNPVSVASSTAGPSHDSPDYDPVIEADMNANP